MKKSTILFAGFEFDSAFYNKSFVQFAINWALKNGDKTFIFSVPKNDKALSSLENIESIEIINENEWNASKIAKNIFLCCSKFEIKTAIYAWIDLPFLNNDLTQRLFDMHQECLSEYTFADGYPYGISPEIIDVGTASILSKLSEDKNIPASRTALMDIMKGDINSFEIETEISDVDYRPLRISLESSSKGGFVSCKNLAESFNNQDLSSLDVIELCEKASSNANVLRNVPHYFDIQITSNVHHKTSYSPENANIGIENLSDMKLSDFENIVKKIVSFNPSAVVSLSCFGEPLLHNDFISFIEIVLCAELRLLIETDGIEIVDNSSILNNLKSILGKYPNANIDWIIDIDGADSSFYSKIRNAPESDFEKATKSVQLLSDVFPNHVYPQFTRMNENEENLERFFRFWKNPENSSNGNLIIKKYDSLCQKLPDKKPADLSPLVRIPCWHLCRDFVILCDGSVPKCRSCGKSELRGNAFSDDFETIWENGKVDFVEQVDKKYNGNCGGCDEYYTFSF